MSPAPPPDAAPRALRIHADDNVAVVTAAMSAGERFEVDGVPLTAPRDLNLGAKIALRPIAAGAKVLKYGEPIGSAVVDIAAGEYVHVHNLRSDYLDHPAAGGAPR
ncbi:MAG: UxaA family hydrolase [Planctomycetes bacterium]|nr:UxaA family hydrolase [Planctomycetota bacterium]